MVFGSFSLYIFFPKVGHRDKAAEWNHRWKRAINWLPLGLDCLIIPCRSRMILPLPIRLHYLSRLYTGKELRAAKLCKHLLREPSDDKAVL